MKKITSFLSIGFKTKINVFLIFWKLITICMKTKSTSNHIKSDTFCININKLLNKRFI
jgi:hypothetical protein